MGKLVADIRTQSVQRLSAIQRTIGPGDVLLYLSEILDLKTLESLALTDEHIALSLASEPSKRIRRLLRPYFPGTDALDKLGTLLAESGALLSGSAALAIVQPGPWKPSDLDFVVPLASYEAFLAFLVDQNYEEIGTLSSGEHATNYGDDRTIKFDLHRFAFDNHVIDLSVIDTSVTNVSPLSFIICYHCTAVMNFITHDRICVLFPFLTFRHKLVIHGWSDVNEVGVAKYRQRGYETVLALPRNSYFAYLFPPITGPVADGWITDFVMQHAWTREVAWAKSTTYNV